MATVRVLGPFAWVRPFGKNYMMPGEGHSWAQEVPNGSQSVFSVSVHPRKEFAVQALAVESLSTAYGREGNPSVNFIVRNIGTEGVSIYRFYVSVIDLV